MSAAADPGGGSADYVVTGIYRQAGPLWRVVVVTPNGDELGVFISDANLSLANVRLSARAVALLWTFGRGATRYAEA